MNRFDKMKIKERLNYYPKRNPISRAFDILQNNFHAISLKSAFDKMKGKKYFDESK